MAENRAKSSSKVDFIESGEQFEELLRDNKTVLSFFQFINEKILMIERKTKHAFVEASYMTNPVIGSFVTAHARQILCSLLLKLSFRVLYCDTDSIIYYLRSGIDQDPIETGPFTGQWKDEEPAGLINFASLSPKNYIFETANGKQVQKHKGLSLGGHMAKLFNFPVAKNLLFKRSIMQLYGQLDDSEMGRLLEGIHTRCEDKGLRQFLIFDDSTFINRNWKKLGAAFNIDDRRTKRMTVNLDKRSVFLDDKLMLDPIVKMRSYPFGALRE